MGRIINNYAAYEVSEAMIAADLAHARAKAELQAEREREQAKWMREQMEKIRTEMAGIPPLTVPGDDGQRKTCPRCSRTLPTFKFYRDRRSLSGRGIYCKDCLSEAQFEARARRAAGKKPTKCKNDRRREMREAIAAGCPTKVCKACGKDLPLVCFHVKDTNKDRRDNTCRECRSKAYKKRARLKKAEERKGEKLEPGMMRCTHCGEAKDMYAEFYLDRRGNPFTWCKECHRKHSRDRQREINRKKKGL